MPVCKFFLQGNCKFGDRCHYEHSRQSDRRQQWDDGEQQYGSHEGGRKDHGYVQEGYNRGGRRQQQQQHGYGREEYSQSPMTRGQNYNEGDSYRERSNQTSGRNQGAYVKDKYHWSKDTSTGSRFAPLSEEKNQDNDVQAMLSAIQNDVKIWAESKMWPFSCYAYKGTSCVEGLSDISPEEMRVLALLHPTEYNNIVREVEATYCKVKDELFAMSDSIKSSLISQMNISDSNPSQNLKIAALYGPEFNFKGAAPQLEPALSPINTDSSTTVNPFVASQHNISTVQQTSFGAAAISQQPSTPINPQTKVSAIHKPQNISVFGSAQKSESPKNDEVYTPHDSLTDNEKKKFEENRFTIGEIPIRPPSERYCR